MENDDRGPPRRVLLAGIARSGTTWIANALGRCRGVSLVHEPDNDVLHVEALAAKADLGRYPLLRRGDAADRYATLMAAAFTDVTPTGPTRVRHAVATCLASGDPARIAAAMVPDGPRWTARLAAARAVAPPPVPGDAPAGPRLVKTVHAPLALDWLLDDLPVDAALVVVRHPANVIGSWHDLGWTLESFPWRDPRLWARVEDPGRAPSTPAGDAERAAWHFAFVADALLEVAERRRLPGVDHEDVLADPAPRLADVAAGLGLEWGDDATRWVHDRDRAGEGYEIERVAADERGRWRTRLSRDERAVVAGVLERFPRLAGRWELRA